MKRLIISTLVALSISAFADAPAITEIAPDENPGHLDNPSAIALVQAQIRDNDLDPVFFDIKFVSSEMTKDGNGAVQIYSVVNKKDGSSFTVIVAVHWAKDAAKTGV